MLTIRLARQGRRNQPKFRLVVAEKSRPVKGKFIETIGYYHSIAQPKIFKANEERIKYWISHGAAPSQTVAALCKTHLKWNDLDRFIKPRNLKNPPKKQAKAA